MITWLRWVVGRLKFVVGRLKYGIGRTKHWIGQLISYIPTLVAHHAIRSRLAVEGSRREGREPLRIMAIACWGFPIYSQSFVYHELSEIIKAGFELRFVYSGLHPREHLPPNCAALWDAKRRLVIHPAIGRGDLRFFNRLMPEKVEELIADLMRFSGLTREELLSHRHFLQAFSFARLAHAYRPDYLHSYFFYEGSLCTLVAGRLLDLPRGVSCYADHLLDDFDLKVMPLHLRSADPIVATSERIKEELLGITDQVRPESILVKPNAIDASIFIPAGRSQPADGENLRLICVSRLAAKKGLEHLVEAVRILDSEGDRVDLRILGAADEHDASSVAFARDLERRIVDGGLQDVVRIEGPVPQTEVIRQLQQSHVFVAPFVELASGDKDGIPTSVLEAMATALPVVVTDAGSILEVVADEKDGLIVPQRDPQSLAGAVRRMAADAALRERLGSTARAKILDRFDVEVCEESLHERIRSRVSDSRSRMATPADQTAL